MFEKLYCHRTDAASWLARIYSDTVSDFEFDEFDRWRRASADNEMELRRLLHVLRCVDEISIEIAAKQYERELNAFLDLSEAERISFRL